MPRIGPRWTMEPDAAVEDDNGGAPGATPPFDGRPQEPLGSEPQ